MHQTSDFKWWPERDLNPRHADFQSTCKRDNCDLLAFFSERCLYRQTTPLKMGEGMGEASPPPRACLQCGAPITTGYWCGCAGLENAVDQELVEESEADSVLRGAR